MKILDEILEEIENRAEKATPGPYTVFVKDDDEMGVYRIAEHITDDTNTYEAREANCQFLSEAKTDMPRLVEMVRDYFKRWNEAEVRNESEVSHRRAVEAELERHKAALKEAIECMHVSLGRSATAEDTWINNHIEFYLLQIEAILRRDMEQ